MTKSKMFVLLGANYLHIRRRTNEKFVAYYLFIIIYRLFI